MGDNFGMEFHTLKGYQMHNVGEVTESMEDYLEMIGLVQFEKYGLITLTKKGDEIAAYLLWRHDVLLRFFQRLNHTGGQLSLVEQVEHFMDQETVRNLERLLDAFPKDFEK